jgi:diguanylate cyclase (GGDEF)-like protein
MAAKAKPLRSGEVLGLTAVQTGVRMLPEALLSEAMGPCILYSGLGSVAMANEASKLLLDDIACAAQLSALARQVGIAGQPGFADVRVTSGMTRRFLVRALPVEQSGEAQIWINATELSVQDHLIEALKDSRAMFRELAEGAGDFCAEIDCEGHFRYISPQGALGYDAWMLNAQPVSLWGSDAQSLISREKFGPRDIWATARDGRRCCLSVVAAPVMQRKLWTGTRFIARDVTVEREQARAHVRAQQEQMATLERLSRTDSLTNLANRRAFEDEAQRRVASLERHGGDGALMLIDIDFFKALNDTLGHGAGDDALRALARIMLDVLRETDFAARIGGDEFALWLDGCGEIGARRVAIALQEHMVRVRQIAGGGLVPLSLSIGVALWHRGISDIHAMLRRADDALYTVKRSGRCAYHIWSEA